MSTEMEEKSRCESTYRNCHTENQRNQQDPRTLPNNWGNLLNLKKEMKMKERQKIGEEWEEIEEINNSQNVNQTGQLEAQSFKMKAKNHNLSKERKRTNSGE